MSQQSVCKYIILCIIYIYVYIQYIYIANQNFSHSHIMFLSISIKKKVFLRTDYGLTPRWKSISVLRCNPKSAQTHLQGSLLASLASWQVHQKLSLPSQKFYQKKHKFLQVILLPFRPFKYLSTVSHSLLF